MPFAWIELKTRIRALFVAPEPIWPKDQTWEAFEDHLVGLMIQKRKQFLSEYTEFMHRWVDPTRWNAP